MEDRLPNLRYRMTYIESDDRFRLEDDGGMHILTQHDVDLNLTNTRQLHETARLCRAKPGNTISTAW